MKLTKKQKQEISLLYAHDFYYDEIIEWFEKHFPADTKQVFNSVLKSYDLTHKDWKKICKEVNDWGVEGGDLYETVGLDTMNTLLEKAHVNVYLL